MASSPGCSDEIDEIPSFFQQRWIDDPSKRRATPSWVASPPRWLCSRCPSRRNGAWMRHGPPIFSMARNPRNRYPWENGIYPRKMARYPWKMARYQWLGCSRPKKLEDIHGKMDGECGFSSSLWWQKSCRLENRRIFMCLPNQESNKENYGRQDRPNS